MMQTGVRNVSPFPAAFPGFGLFCFGFLRLRFARPGSLCFGFAGFGLPAFGLFCFGFLFPGRFFIQLFFELAEADIILVVFLFRKIIVGEFVGEFIFLVFVDFFLIVAVAADRCRDQSPAFGTAAVFSFHEFFADFNVAVGADQNHNRISC